MKKLTITILATIALAIIIPTAAFAEYKHGDMIQKINAYCDMSPEEHLFVLLVLAAFLAAALRLAWFLALVRAAFLAAA